MSLSERSRSILYQSLSPVVGDEQAVQEMLSHFPAGAGDEVATKDFVRAEISELRGELHSALRTNLQWVLGINLSIAAFLVAVLR